MFIRTAAAYDICARMAYGGLSLDAAAQQVVMDVLPAIGGRGGLIAVDARGNLSLPFNTEGMYRGHDRMRQYVSDLSEAFEHLRPEPTDLLDAGDIVIGVGVIHYRGRESGVETGSAIASWPLPSASVSRRPSRASTSANSRTTSRSDRTSAATAIARRPSRSMPLTTASAADRSRR